MLNELFYGLAIPMAVAAAIGVLSLLFSPFFRRPCSTGWAPAAAYVTAYIGLLGIPELPPTEAIQASLFGVGLGAVVEATLLSTRPGSPVLGVLLTFLVAALSGLAFMWNLVRESFALSTTLYEVAKFSLVTAGFYLTFRVLSMRLTYSKTSMTFVVLFAIASGVMLASKTLLLAQLAGAVSAACGMLFLLSALPSGRRVVSFNEPIVLSLLFSHFLTGANLYAELPSSWFFAFVAGLAGVGIGAYLALSPRMP